jgi:hypothetical protein
MAICSCGLPAGCCQPAVAGGVIYADLWDEINTHLASQALFTQSSPVHKPLLQAFPFPNTLGEVTLHSLFLACMFLFTPHVGSGSSPLSCGICLPLPLLQAFPLLIAGHDLLPLPASMFVYSSHGRWVFPTLLWSFPPSASLTCFPIPGCWAHAPTPAGASLARHGLFIYSSGKDFPLPSLVLSAPHPLCNVSLLLLLLITQFLFFPQWRLVCPGTYAVLAQGCLWDYHILLSSPCPCHPNPSGCQQLAAQGPFWFLCLT